MHHYLVQSGSGLKSKAMCNEAWGIFGHVFEETEKEDKSDCGKRREKKRRRERESEIRDYGVLRRAQLPSI